MGKDRDNAEAGNTKISREEMTFDKIGDVMARFKNISCLFGDNESKVVEKMEELQMAFGLAFADKKNMAGKIEKRLGQKPDKKFRPDVQEQLAEKVDALLDVIDQSLASGKPEKNTYARNVLQMARDQVGLVLDPDYALVDGQDALQEQTWGHIIDFPVNRFSTGDAEKDKNREFVKDDARYEEFMGKYSAFYDMMADRTDFVKNEFLPYQKRKKEGKTTKQEDLEFNTAYREHLDRQTGYWEKIKDYPVEEMRKVDPFARSQTQFSMNWAGDRGARNAFKSLDFQKKALANGWPVEDLTFLDNMSALNGSVYDELEGDIKSVEKTLADFMKGEDNARNEAQKAKEAYEEAVKAGDQKQAEEKQKALEAAEKRQRNVEKMVTDKRTQLNHVKEEAGRSPWVKDKKQLDEAYRKLTETVVSTPQERKKLIEGMKPFVDKWNQLGGKEKTETRTNITSCDEALKRDGTGQLTPDNRKRGEIIKSLEAFRKKLNQGHRIGSHTDSKEMQDLKKKLNQTLRALKENKKGIYDDKTISDMLKEVSQSARAYTDAKKEGAGVSKDSTTYEPKTKMGKIRYQAAMDLEKAMRKLSKEVGGKVAPYAVGKRMKEKGFKVISEDALHLEHGQATYNAKTITGMNYFGKEPVCIQEHCTPGGNRVFTEEEFARQCKPYKLDGVSNEEFAFTAYAAIFNPSVISKKLDENFPMKDVDDPSKSVPHDEIARTKRAMYAMDFFRDPPRATMGEKFNDECLVPAREEAFQALSEYKAGKPERLAGLMATGMKEIHNEAMLCEHIYRGGDSDFNSHMTMVSGMIGMMKKDPALMEQVKGKLGPEMVEDIRDDLRLKEFIDKAENSKRKMEEAGKTNQPLSAEEKRSCMQDIMRAEFADTARAKAWNEMLGKNEKFMEYAKNEAQFIMDLAMNKTTLTSEDYACRKGQLQREAIKPVFKVTKALRTPEGMQTFENTVSQLTAGMNVNKPEKELLADVNAAKEQLSSKKNAEQKAPARTAPKKKGPVNEKGLGAK